MLCDTLAGSDF